MREVGGVHIARHHRERFDVPPGQPPLENGTLSDLDLIEGAVLDQRLERRTADPRGRRPALLVGTHKSIVTSAVLRVIRAVRWRLRGFSAEPMVGLRGLDQLVLERIADEVRSRRQAQLLLDVGPVGLDRANRQVQLVTDLGVGVPERDQAQHVDLALR